MYRVKLQRSAVTNGKIFVHNQSHGADQKTLGVNVYPDSKLLKRSIALQCFDFCSTLLSEKKINVKELKHLCLDLLFFFMLSLTQKIFLCKYFQRYTVFGTILKLEQNAVTC
jgi:hypothetical protein